MIQSSERCLTSAARSGGYTYSHCNLDEAPRAIIETEIERNVSWARRAGIALEPGTLVTGEHSGLANFEATPRRPENPERGPALCAQGILHIARDASRPYPVRSGDRDGDHARSGVPFPVGPALAIPRYPTALPFDAATRRQAVDRWRAQRGGEPPARWEQVLAAESRRIFITMISNDPRPHYFHQSNLVTGLDAEASEEALLCELIDAVLHHYWDAVGEMTIAQPTLGEIGDLVRDRIAWGAALSAGSILAHRDTAGVRIENRSDAALRVPLTGTVAGAWYGVARSGWVLIEPGETLVALERSLAA